ncbi:hypothetical protein SG18_14830 [Pandoraea apista]|nr:hypothetical protein SG18_14830 [Pandoraea apista]AKH73242.1 hypothetical protein XM39_15025 [Pandoraea apista]AKI61638.1 hypothetical protein AA956_07365 [Pandoraea apista]
MKNQEPQKPQFPLGDILATAGAVEVLSRTNTNVVELLRRHVSGDWGVVCAADELLNQQAILGRGRILSSYVIGPQQERVWIITEADRSATTILTPAEY